MRTQEDQINLFICVLCIIIIFFIPISHLAITHDYEYQIEQLQSAKYTYQNTANDYKASILELQERLYEYERPIGGMEHVPERLASTDFVFPIHPEDFIRYTSPFGLRESPFLKVQMQHNGVDIATIWRAQVLAIADGIVIEHWPPPGTIHPNGSVFRGHPVYGGMVKIDHGDFTSLYAHLSETVIRTNQQVRAGEMIGRVGNTGMSRGHHLHFELKINGEIVNPLLYLDNLFAYEFD